jgi:glutamate/tyrosine decarboxylase-like PLP-dependent enzyme
MLAVNSVDSYRDVLSDACARAQRYLETIANRRVVVSRNAIQNLVALATPLAEQGQAAEQILELLDHVGSPATTASMGRRFFGGVIGGALPVAVAAHWLADAWDQNACLFEFSPVGCYLEDVVLGWFVDLFGLPAGSGGALVTGTQMADVTALAAARLSVLEKRVGCRGRRLVWSATHIRGRRRRSSRHDAEGFGATRPREETYPRSSSGPARAHESGTHPTFAEPGHHLYPGGNVNTGACDPVAEICQVAHDMGAWVHVDGAFGLWAAVTPQRRHLVEGIALADSWAADAHKWLNVPQDSGIAIVRDPALLQRAMSITAAYYPEPSNRRDPMKWGPESSRRARAIEIWAALRSLGRCGVAELVEQMCQHATAFEHGLRAAGYEVLNDVVLNQVLVSFGDDQATTRVIDAIQQGHLLVWRYNLEGSEGDAHQRVVLGHQEVRRGEEFDVNPSRSAQITVAAGLNRSCWIFPAKGRASRAGNRTRPRRFYADGKLEDQTHSPAG